MTKLTLNDVANISGAESTAIGVLNDNSDRIVAALENTLSRDGTLPNSMGADLDMGNNDILNVDNITANTLVLDGVLVTPLDSSLIPERPVEGLFLVAGSFGVWPDGHPLRGSDTEFEAALTVALATSAAQFKPLLFMPGDYSMAPREIIGYCNWIGAGKNETHWVMRTGFTSSPYFLNCVFNGYGPAFRASNTKPRFFNGRFDGKNSGATTVGLNFPEPDPFSGWYGYGPELINVSIEYFAKNLFVDTNRNNVIISNCNITYAKINNIHFMNIFDNRIDQSNIGSSGQHCVLLEGTQYTYIVNSDVFRGGYVNAIPNDLYANFDSLHIIGGAGNIYVSSSDVSAAGRHAIYFDATFSSMPFLTIHQSNTNNTFFAAGKNPSQTGTIKLVGPARLRMSGISSQTAAGMAKPDYYIDASATSWMSLSGIDSTVADPPYSVSFTSQPTREIYSGNDVSGLRGVSSGGLSVFSNSVETLRATSTSLFSLVTHWFSGTVSSVIARFSVSSAALNEKYTDINSSATQFFISLVNDAGVVGQRILESTRSGTNVLSATLARALRVVNVTGGVNLVEITGGATTVASTISAEGSDATVGLVVATKGTNFITFRPNGKASATAELLVTTSALTYDGSPIGRDNRVNRCPTFTFATLPTPASVGVTGRAFITDGAAAPVFMANAAGGGTLLTPVYSDGTTWKVG